MPERGYITGKRSGAFPIALAVHDTKEAAQEFCDSANRWYGEGHPLTPLTVWPGDVFYNPKPFPDPNGTIEEIFGSLADG